MVAIAVVAGLLTPLLAGQQDDTDTVYKPGNGVVMPRVVSDVKPQYTADAFRRRVNGSVFLECVVNREGVPTNVEVVTSLDEELDREALKALSQWRFEPGRKDGKTVSVRIEVQMAFTTP